MFFSSTSQENIAQKCQRWFWWFLIIHNILWVIMPTWLRYALPHDTIEGALWGQHLELGYDKNPWMNAWLTRLGWALGGTSGVGIYALSSVFVAISFWAVWRLANKFLHPLYALIAVFLLEGCINYTLVPQAFNDNLIELGLWPLMFLCFYQAIKQQKTRYWLATGIVAGLAMMAKYYTAIPLVIMFIFLVCKSEGRRNFAKSGIYLSLISFILVCLPHMIWLFQHNFITIAYAANRTENIGLSSWKLHLLYPIDFALAQIINFIFPLFLLCLLYSRKKLNQTYLAKPDLLPTFPRQFLLTMAFGPYLLTLLLAIIFGWRLFNEWGVPLASLWGLILIAFSQPAITLTAFKRFFIIIYIVMFLWAAIYAIGLTFDKRHRHSDNYPAQEIADYVTQQWWNQYHKPLKYVAGSRYIAGYIAFYSADHPSVYVEWNDQFSPWLDIKDMKKYGAVFVQDNYYGTLVFGNKKPETDGGNHFPSEILHQFPNLKIIPVKYFDWHRTNTTLKPIPVLIGILPPEK